MTNLRWFGTSALAVLKGIPAAAKARAGLLVLGTLVVGLLVVLLHWWDPAFEAFANSHQQPGWVQLAQRLSAWGELQFAPLIALIALAVMGRLRHSPGLTWAALAGLLSGCIGGITVNIVKVIFGRPRPCTPLPDGIHWFTTGWDYASFPSGHATHCFAIAAAVCMLAPRSGAAIVLGSLAVCWSRWYLIRHYVTDVTVGAWLGIAIGIVVGLAARRVLQQSARAAVRAGDGHAQPFTG